LTIKEKTYTVPATVGTEGDNTSETLQLCHSPSTDNPVNVALIVPDTVCVPVRPAKIRREEVSRGTEVANVMEIVLSALGFHELCAAEKRMTRDP